MNVRYWMTTMICGASVLAGSAVSLALEPFECALLVNEDSQASLELANHYARLRDIPDENVVRLALPEKVLASPYSLTADEFQDQIRRPVLAELRERGLQKRILAWIYSVDFPIRVETGQGKTISLQGMTLFAEDMPSANEIDKGHYVSPIYRGPGPQKKSLEKSLSFDRLIDGARIGRLVPSMMLSFTRARGLTVAESKLMLQKGAMADASNPDGTVYFVETDDMHRSKPRHWQFEPVAKLLRRSGVKAEVAGKFPRNQKGVMGLQTGNSTVNPKLAGTYRAGAMAEHLTSWAACFDIPWHTKATAWLRAGATTSSGTVTEPYALWPKFPTAFFFYHYRNGCTAIESYFQSVRCPVQLLMLGDPLARPWIRTARLTLVTLDDGPQEGNAQFFARIFPKLDANMKPELKFYLDGRRLNAGLRQGVCEIDTTEIADGYHRLLAIVDTASEVNVKPFTSHGFVVDNRGRMPVLTGLSGGQKVDIHRPCSVKISADSEAISVGVRSRGIVLGATDASQSQINIKPKKLGAGLVPLQAFAVYPDGEEARSEPLEIEVADLNSPPRLVEVGKKAPGLAVAVEDQDGDDVAARWMRRFLKPADQEMDPGEFACLSGEIKWSGAAMKFSGVKTNDYDLCIVGAEGVWNNSVVADMSLNPSGNGNPKQGQAGLAFGIEDEKNFGFFVFHAAKSEWALGFCKDGNMIVEKARGARLDVGGWSRLAVELDGAGTLTASVDGRQIMEMPAVGKLAQGPAGILCVKRSASFRNLMVAFENGKGFDFDLPDAVDSRDVSVILDDGINAVCYDAEGEKL